MYCRIYCPQNCLQEHPQVSRVIGSKIYSDVSGKSKTDLNRDPLMPIQVIHK